MKFRLGNIITRDYTSGLYFKQIDPNKAIIVCCGNNFYVIRDLENGRKITSRDTETELYYKIDIEIRNKKIDEILNEI